MTNGGNGETRQPRSLPRFYRWPAIYDNPLRFHDVLRETGDFTLWKGLSDLYILNHPDYVRPILLGGPEHVSKRTVDYRVLSRILGAGLVSSDGPLWERQRRIIQPFFAHHHLQRFEEIINRVTANMVEGWRQLPDGETVRLDQEMRRLALRIGGLIIFGFDIDSHVAALEADLNAFNRPPRDVHARLSLFPWIPTPHNRKLSLARRRLDRIVYELIDKGRKADVGEEYLLSRLMGSASARGKGKANDKQIRDEVVTFLLSGVTPTASALTWTLHLIATHPGAEARLVESLYARLNGAPGSAADLERLPYLHRVVLEALRLYPPVWAIARRAEREYEMNGYVLPAKASVAIMPYSLHRHPEFWPDPERFDPDRFHPTRSKGRHFFCYLPFAAGARMCIGAGMAMLQNRLVLAQILQNFRLQPVPGYPVEPVGRATVEPRHGLPVILTRR